MKAPTSQHWFPGNGVTRGLSLLEFSTLFREVFLRVLRFSPLVKNQPTSSDNPVNQSKLKVITRSRQKPRENVHVRATIGFVFSSDWLKKWREKFEPSTEWGNGKPNQFANYFQQSIDNRSISCLIWFDLCTYTVSQLVPGRWIQLNRNKIQCFTTAFSSLFAVTTELQLRVLCV